jgi:hypothetical protein
VRKPRVVVADPHPGEMLVTYFASEPQPLALDEP